MKTDVCRGSVFVLLIAALSGCSSSNDAPPTPEVAQVTQKVAGFWSASEVTIAGQAHSIDCLVSDAQDIACRLYINTGVFVAAMNGRLLVDGQRVSGNGTMFRSQSRALPDGSDLSDFAVVAGIVNEFDFLNITIQAAGEEFTPQFVYNTNLYDRGSALSTVAGVYPHFDFLGDPASFSVDATGAITSQSDSGCICNGRVEVINSQFNVYDVTLNVSNCAGLNGDYSGLGLTTYVVIRDNAEAHNPTSNDVFLFNVFTDQSVIDGIASK